MLSDEEKRELKAMASSKALREEFERLRAASAFPRSQPVNLDQFIDFLTTMSRLSPTPLPPRTPITYTCVLL